MLEAFGEKMGSNGLLGREFLGCLASLFWWSAQGRARSSMDGFWMCSDVLPLGSTGFFGLWLEFVHLSATEGWWQASDGTAVAGGACRSGLVQGRAGVKDGHVWWCVQSIGGGCWLKKNQRKGGEGCCNRGRRERN